ncbi:MAG TPA: N-acetylglucosamine-6-phosphate deacetylase [Actinocrinis sp.]|nr:N-acetylglucosamine-6-phosphate deacetylase [Actinocrinis sp.]
MPTIFAPRAVIDGQLTGPVTLTVTDTTITALAFGQDPADADVVLEQGILTAGLVDIQINGAFGVDFSTATDEDWDHVSRSLPATGVTSYQPTYITAPLGLLLGRLPTAGAAQRRQAGTGVARILGIHLEGPFLSPAKHGVHEAKYLIEPSPAAVDQLLGAEGRELVTMLTLAPELPGAFEAIQRLTGAGVRVSVGHTDATAAQIKAAADAGATLVTHIFNAQRGLAHREPGVPGQAMADRRYHCGLIADLIHVVPEICTLVWRGARGRVVLVTDAIAAAGMPAGDYELSGIPVTVGADGVPRNADGTLAGSALTLDQAVRNMISLGLPEAEVVDAASRVPADAIGRPDLGRIGVGARADLVLWSEDFHPLRTWVDGREVAGSSRDLTAPRESLAVSP